MEFISLLLELLKSGYSVQSNGIHLYITTRENKAPTREMLMADIFNYYPDAYHLYTVRLEDENTGELYLKHFIDLTGITKDM